MCCRMHSLILDGYSGVVIINPTEETIAQCKRRSRELTKFEHGLNDLRELPAETMDGKQVELVSNIEFAEEIRFSKAQGSHGIGLYRTEGLLMGRDAFPSEEEQYREYKSIAEKVYPNKVIMRTFDIGGDKVIAHSHEEENPFLGWRGIRVALDRPETFLAQMRAMLRASAKKNIWVMFPMVSSLKEVRRAKALVTQAKDSLRAEKVVFDDTMKIGVMIEVPSAAVVAGDIAREVDFLSIGTNDLIQYLLAVDRGNDIVSQLYQEFEPAVILTIRHIIKEAHKNKIPVSMCGEMAGDPVVKSAAVIKPPKSARFSIRFLFRAYFLEINSARCLPYSIVGPCCSHPPSTTCVSRRHCKWARCLYHRRSLPAASGTKTAIQLLSGLIAAQEATALHRHFWGLARAEGSRSVRPSDLIDEDGQNDDCSDRHVLPERRESLNGESIAQRVGNKGTDHGAYDRARAAE